LKLATAESCTGGLLASTITDVPGASEVFAGGIVSYTDAVKEKVLGVSSGPLRRLGAVSRPVARAMAERARKKFRTDFALATTGFAGPNGGTKEKPVGTVYIALAHRSGTTVVRRLNRFPRKKFKLITVRQALELLLNRLQKA
jgi:PncC family amidohydrolase